MLKKEVDFKTFRTITEAPEKSLLEEKPELKKQIKKFVVRNTDLSDNALVSLVVLHNTGSLDEKYKEELELHEYISEANKITDRGNTYLNDTKIIERLKAML